MQHLAPVCCRCRMQHLAPSAANAAPKCCKCRKHDSKKLAAPVSILKMQHLKILHIEYAANLRVHLASKFAAHFSQIAFCLPPALCCGPNLAVIPSISGVSPRSQGDSPEKCNDSFEEDTSCVMSVLASLSPRPGPVFPRSSRRLFFRLSQSQGPHHRLVLL